MGFLELRHQCGVSHEVRWGAQGASRVAPGKSGLHAHSEGELVITLESWEAARSSRGVEEDSRGLSRVAAETLVSLDFCRGPSGTSQEA